MSKSVFDPESGANVSNDSETIVIVSFWQLKMVMVFHADRAKDACLWAEAVKNQYPERSSDWTFAITELQ